MNRISLALVISAVFCVVAHAATADQLTSRSASLSAAPAKPFTAAERQLFERASQTWGEAN
jgi:hypothetical protein